MDEIEHLIGKNVSEIDSEIIKSLESICFKVAILEYKYKNCGKRYPIETLRLDAIDYRDVISFDDLIDFFRSEAIPPVIVKYFPLLLE